MAASTCWRTLRYYSLLSRRATHRLAGRGIGWGGNVRAWARTAAHITRTPVSSPEYVTVLASLAAYVNVLTGLPQGCHDGSLHELLTGQPLLSSRPHLRGGLNRVSTGLLVASQGELFRVQYDWPGLDLLR